MLTIFKSSTKPETTTNITKPPAPRVEKTKAPEAADRVAARIPASSVSSIQGIRLSPPGVDAKLVNISTTGMLVECAARIKAGSLVTIVFDGTFTPRSMNARVIRTTVSSLGQRGQLLYHVGLTFSQKIEIELDPPPETAGGADAADHIPQSAMPPPAERPSSVSAVRNRW